MRNPTLTSRRQFLGLTGLAAASPGLLGPRRARAQATPGGPPRMRAPEPNPRRGGTLKTAFGVTTPHFDIHQGASTAVLCHLYNGLVTYNLGDGIKTVIPDLAARWTYLSVTPHLEPTHTMWDDSGKKLPPRYGVATTAERASEPGPTAPTADLADRHAAAARALAEATATSAAAQEAGASALKRAVVAGDTAAAKAAVDHMWEQVSRAYRSFQAFELAWNPLASRLAE